MTDTIEQKALAMVNEVRDERGLGPTTEFYRKWSDAEALCRAIERHEATKQELSDYEQKVSDAVGHVLMNLGARHWAQNHLNHFIIPAPKPDPLVQVMRDLDWVDEYADRIRAALEARGLEIREKNDEI